MVKAILESIPMYWMFIAHIPKAFLTKTENVFHLSMDNEKEKGRNPSSQMDKRGNSKGSKRMGFEEYICI